MGRLDELLRKLDSDTTDFLNRPAANQEWRPLRRRGSVFFKRRGIGVMTDGGHHGEGEHDQRYVPMPAMPGAALIVIEAEFVLGGLEAVFDGQRRPSAAINFSRAYPWGTRWRRTPSHHRQCCGGSANLASTAP